MRKRSTEEIIGLIEKGEPFRGLTENGEILIVIDEYVPYLCLAVHNGGNMRPGIRDKSALLKQERWKEEDPFTWRFIDSLPMRIVGYASRYEYDLNRPEEECVYETAWGHQVWKEPLTPEEKAESLEKHRLFYTILDALAKKLQEKFGGAVVYDIHSYNHKRYDNPANLPLFNLGTERIDRKKFSREVNHWLKAMKSIDLNGEPVTVAENGPFFGRGYVLQFITSRYPSFLVLATEIKKIYVDEESGDEYPELIENLRVGMKKAIVENAYHFARERVKIKLSDKYDLLAKVAPDDTLELVDKALFAMLGGIEVIEYVNPRNIETERKRFFASRWKAAPQFHYKPLPIDMAETRRKLYRLPLEKIGDMAAKKLMEGVMEAASGKLEMLTLRGKEEFLYASMKYFGKPTALDLGNAKYLLHCATPEAAPEERLDHDGMAAYLAEYSREIGVPCKIQTVKNLSADAMVLNATRTVKIRKGASASPRELRALACHEVGIHMLTTRNAMKQPLKALFVGLPRYTETQEGMAILSEYLSGCLGVGRLKTLALRVVAVDAMVGGSSFADTYALLREEYGAGEEEAFRLALRVFRGGGFTKDHLYLRGFINIFRRYKEGKDFAVLLAGKTSLAQLPELVELTERGFMQAPENVPDFFTNPVPADPILEYVLQGLRTA